MHRSWKFLLAAMAACGGNPSEEYAVIPDFLDRSPPASCQALPAPEPLAVTEIRTASDSTVLVLDGPGRRVLELDSELRVIWSMEAPSDGPGSLDAPIDAVTLADTAVAVAERRGLQLLVYSRTGSLIRASPLSFIPGSLAATADGDLLITAAPVGGGADAILFRYDGEETVPVGVPPRRYEDMIVTILGNTALVGVLPNGDALVVHQFLAPRGFRVGADGSLEALRVPTPDATLAQLPYVPTPPITENQLPRILVPAMGMTMDPHESQVYLLTRSGRLRNGKPERAILRLDHRLALLESFTIGVQARGMAYLAGPGIMMVVDDEDRFHACVIPTHGERHARGR